MERSGSGLSPEPQVKLLNAFATPYDNAVAAARTCYSSKVVYPEDVRKTEKSRGIRDKIMKSIYEAGHHTTIQHQTFQFVIEKVSRQFLWSFLHSHPFYNSEQVSQRYVDVDQNNFLTPPLMGKAADVYRDTIRKQMEAYFKLIDMTSTTVRDEYFRIYPARKADESAWKDAIHKRVIESARYVLPIATHAHLYHTVSGLTLHRYHKLCLQYDTPLEARSVVQKMVEEVNKADPLFFSAIEDQVPLEETLEYRLFNRFHAEGWSGSEASAFVKEFDESLGTYRSKLVDYKANGEAVMAQAARTVLGLPKERLPDAEAIDLVMNPAHNPHMSGALNVKTLSKLSRVMYHPHFTFRKKLSHTADSQDQRHRMTPASRPILMSHFVYNKPDYILPTLLEQDQRASAYIAEVMDEVWTGITTLLEMDVSPEFAQYLIPNAFPIRFEESGDLLNCHHKWTTRLCYLAQEEIWRCCLEEVRQVADRFPNIGKTIAAPCGLRKAAGESPFCPEGNRFCGVNVWNLALEDYRRTI